MGLCGPSSSGALVAPLGFYEGAFASHNPYASVVSPLGSGLAAGPTDLAMGRFGWADPLTGLVSNVRPSNGILGLVVPRFGLWSLGYWSGITWFLRSGKMVVLAGTGDFYVRFPQGATVGQPVWADPATGIAYTADGGGFQLTPWVTATAAGAGCLGVISQAQDFKP